MAVSKENSIPPPNGACDGHNHATWEIVPVVNSPDPSGVASTALLSPSPPFSLNNRTARANLLLAKWQDIMDANIATLTPVQEKLASDEATMAKVFERLGCVKTTLASNHATGGIALRVASSPDQSGIAITAVLSLPACVMKSPPPSTVTASPPPLVMMGG